MKIKYLNDGDQWMPGEDIPDMDLFFAQIWLSCFANEFKYPSGRAYKKILTVFRGFHLWFYYGENDSRMVGENIAEKIIKNPAFAQKINKEIIRWSNKLRAYVAKISKMNLKEFSNKKLWEVFEEHDKIHTQYYQWGWLPVAADMFHNNLTDCLKDFLRKIGVSEEKLNEYLVILTTPVRRSLIQIEEEDFLKIARRIFNSKKYKKIFKELYLNFEKEEAMPYGLATHTREYERLLEEKSSELVGRLDKSLLKSIQSYYLKYFYVEFLWIGKEGIDTFEGCLKKLVKYIGRGFNPLKQLAEKEIQRSRALRTRQQLIKKLKIKNPLLSIFTEWGNFMVTKIYRRYAQIFAVYQMQPVLEEISKRIKVPKKIVQMMLKSEVKDVLLNNKINRKSLKGRGKLFVYYVEKGKEIIFMGEKARQLDEKVKQSKIEDVGEIKGQTGCVGRAKGIVRKIIRPKDMAKMKKGDILVSIATDPDIVPAMKKAAAIVTEQGGVTSHAAIVSRELGIPCVIGTKIATRVLKDGDIVEVDATKGVVKKI